MVQLMDPDAREDHGGDHSDGCHSAEHCCVVTHCHSHPGTASMRAEARASAALSCLQASSPFELDALAKPPPHVPSVAVPPVLDAARRVGRNSARQSGKEQPTSRHPARVRPPRVDPAPGAALCACGDGREPVPHGAPLPPWISERWAYRFSQGSSERGHARVVRIGVTRVIDGPLDGPREARPRRRQGRQLVAGAASEPALVRAPDRDA
jgi:hypothetical protein